MIKNNVSINWLLSVLAWVVVVYFYALLTVFGFKKYFEQNPITDYIYSDAFHLEIVMTGVIIGSLFVVINQISDSRGLRKRSFGFIIVFKSLLYVASLVLCAVLVYLVFSSYKIVSAEQFEYYREYLLDWRYLLSVSAYFLFFIFLMNFIIQVNQKFGPGVLIDLLRGRYYHPRQEHLILLFIDLKGSTTIAESLGHEKYSQLIRECVHELTPVLVKNDAHVYQYVGDEIVLHWKTDEGLDRFRCLNTFFEFRERLATRKDHFMSRYGVIPEFKAGMDAGEVTVTEIGDVKREIAFHGDVLNTASRLEKKCSEYQKWLLASENLISRISASGRFEFEFLSSMPLRGKHESVKFYAVGQSGVSNNHELHE